MRLLTLTSMNVLDPDISEYKKYFFKKECEFF